MTEPVTFPTIDMDEDWADVIPGEYLIYTSDVSGVETREVFEVETPNDAEYVIERTAHFIGRLINFAVRGDQAQENTIENGIVKLFAPKFINETGKEKTGEIYEIEEVDGMGVAEGLDEAADIVGKYALGIERVSQALDIDVEHWKGFARDLAAALGFHYEDILAAFVVKYDERFQNGKNKEKEFQRVQNLVRSLQIKPISTIGFLEDRIAEVKAKYRIDERLQNMYPLKQYDLSAIDNTVNVDEEVLISLDNRIRHFTDSGYPMQTFSYHY
ncbi:MAG TPA: hypothetical protein VGA67_04160 [Candidatus Dojkabacteria bacterium]|jgi:hypothetical protein